MTTEHPDTTSIPSGPYCYEYRDGLRHTCPHWKATPDGARCEHLNLHSVRYQMDNLVWDQVKECGVHDGSEA